MWSLGDAGVTAKRLQAKGAGGLQLAVALFQKAVFVLPRAQLALQQR
jgi:hypothetical protein